MIRKIYLILSLFLIISCGSSGEKFYKLEQPKDDKALVYFYRPSKYTGSMVSLQIKDGENRITTLSNGTYYPYFTTAGEKTFSATTESTSKVTLNLKNGETYFIKGAINMGVIMGRPKLEEVKNREEALKALEKCKISNTK